MRARVPSALTTRALIAVPLVSSLQIRRRVAPLRLRLAAMMMLDGNPSLRTTPQCSNQAAPSSSQRPLRCSLRTACASHSLSMLAPSCVMSSSAQRAVAVHLQSSFRAHLRHTSVTRPALNSTSPWPSLARCLPSSRRAPTRPTPPRRSGSDGRRTGCSKSRRPWTHRATSPARRRRPP